MGQDNVLQSIRLGKNADIQLHLIDIYYNSLLHPLHDEFAEDLITL